MLKVHLLFCLFPLTILAQHAEKECIQAEGEFEVKDGELLSSEEASNHRESSFSHKQFARWWHISLSVTLAVVVPLLVWAGGLRLWGASKAKFLGQQDHKDTEDSFMGYKVAFYIYVFYRFVVVHKLIQYRCAALGEPWVTRYATLSWWPVVFIGFTEVLTLVGSTTSDPLVLLGWSYHWSRYLYFVAEGLSWVYTLCHGRFYRELWGAKEE